jgi:hypothetical protein
MWLVVFPHSPPGRRPGCPGLGLYRPGHYRSDLWLFGLPTRPGRGGARLSGLAGKAFDQRYPEKPGREAEWSLGGGAWNVTARISCACSLGPAQQPYLLTSSAVAGSTGEGRPLTGTGKRGAAPFERVIVLGIDGLDPRLLRQLMVAGKLPNFARLANSGTFAALRTTNPPQSPVAWSSMGTSLNPGGTGIFGFIRRKPKTYLPEFSLMHQSGSALSRQCARARPFGISWQRRAFRLRWSNGP